MIAIKCLSGIVFKNLKNYYFFNIEVDSIKKFVYFLKNIVKFINNMENQELINYIKNSIKQGRTKEEIYKYLLDQGLSLDIIQSAFSQAENTLKEENVSKEGDLNRFYAKTVRIIVTIGAILIGLGFFSIFVPNWEFIPQIAKLLVIIGGMLVSYTAGWILKAKFHYERTGEALILIGNIIYGAGIFLFAQMFNIKGIWPDGLIFWMIGGVIMGLILNSISLFYFSILVAIISIVGYFVFIFKHWLTVNLFLKTSSFLLLIATIFSFVIALLFKIRIKAELKDKN